MVEDGLEATSKGGEVVRVFEGATGSGRGWSRQRRIRRPEVGAMEEKIGTLWGVVVVYWDWVTVWRRMNVEGG